MNIRNAWGFLSFGFVMIALPLLMPAWFPPTGFDGTSARALWLEFMGGLQALLGAVRMLWQLVVPAVVGRLVFEPPAEETVAPVALFQNPKLSADSEPPFVEADPVVEAA